VADWLGSQGKNYFVWLHFWKHDADQHYYHIPSLFRRMLIESCMSVDEVAIPSNGYRQETFRQKGNLHENQKCGLWKIVKGQGGDYASDGRQIP
jgi:hypothetical protein